MAYSDVIKRFIFFTAIIAFLTSCTYTKPLAKTIILMDTFVKIEIRDDISNAKKIEAINQALARMKELEKKFNYFSKDSELTRLNDLKGDEGFSMSKEMAYVLKASEDFKRNTRGAFDVRIGRDKKVDLGGIAKGFIVDEGIEVLKKHGIKNAIINAGGDMYCLGKGDGNGWRVGIRDPKNHKKVTASFRVINKGVATSGMYERPGHIIDPRTGEPVKATLRSVTVVADDCMTADALATALYVLGPEVGVKVVEDIEGTDCVIIDEDGKAYRSSDFPEN